MTRKNVEVIQADSIATADESLLLEPFFRKRSESVKILRLKSFPERKAVGDAYAEIGCLRCQSKDRPHSACGLCTVCRRWYANLLQRMIRARLRGETE